jgi:hypothetical protein
MEKEIDPFFAVYTIIIDFYCKVVFFVTNIIF